MHVQVNVMGYDYTGYGRSTGTPSEADCYAAIVAAFSWLLQEKDLLPNEVILYGRSIGSGPLGGSLQQADLRETWPVGAHDLGRTHGQCRCNQGGRRNALSCDGS